MQIRRISAVSAIVVSALVLVAGGSGSSPEAGPTSQSAGEDPARTYLAAVCTSGHSRMLLSLYADSISAGRAPAAEVLSSAVTTAIDESRRTADAMSSAPPDWPGEVAADIATVAASERIRDVWSLGKPGDCPATAYSNDVLAALVLKASPMLGQRSADTIALGQQFCSMKSGGLSDDDAAAQRESAGVTASSHRWTRPSRLERRTSSTRPNARPPCSTPKRSSPPRRRRRRWNRSLTAIGSGRARAATSSRTR